MVCAFVHGADHCYRHVPFALQVYELFKLIDKVGPRPACKDASVQAMQCPADGLDLGRFGKHAQDRNDTSWCVPPSMELIITAGMFDLSCGCMAIN